MHAWQMQLLAADERVSVLCFLDRSDANSPTQKDAGWVTLGEKSEKGPAAEQQSVRPHQAVTMPVLSNVLVC